MKILKNNGTLIGLLLISLIVCIYLYSSNMVVLNLDLIKVAGTLKAKPYLGSEGGDMSVEYIRFELNEYDNIYYLNNCAYDMCKKKEVLGLNADNQLEIYIKNDQLEKKNQNIYSLSTEDKQLLTLEDYNSCYVNRWKYLVPIMIVLMLILLVRILINMGIIKNPQLTHLFGPNSR